MPVPAIIDLTTSDEERAVSPKRTSKHKVHNSSKPPLAFRITGGDGSEQSPLSLDDLARPPSPSIPRAPRPSGQTTISASKRKQLPFQNPSSALKKAPATPSKLPREVTQPVKPVQSGNPSTNPAQNSNLAVNNWPKCLSCSKSGLNCDGERPCSECSIFGIPCTYGTDSPPKPQPPQPIPDFQPIEQATHNPNRPPIPLITDEAQQTAREEQYVSVFADIESEEDAGSGIEDREADTEVILALGFFENLMDEFRKNMHDFQEYTLRPLLQQSRIDSKTRDTSSIPQPSKSPFEAFDPQITKFPTPDPIIGLLVNRNPNAPVLKQKWDPVAVPITQVQTRVTSLPKYKSIGRMGISLLARNVTIGKYNHYVAEDENNTWADLAQKYQEVGERYHTYESISRTLHAQRLCAEFVDLWRPWIEKLMKRIDIGIGDIRYYYGHDSFTSTAWNEEAGLADAELAAWLSEQHKDCAACQGGHFEHKTDLWEQRLSGIKAPTPRQLAVAGLLCYTFHKAEGVSLWHLVSTSSNTRPAPEDISRKQGGAQQAGRLCLVCGLHNCSIHGAFVEEDGLLSGHLDRDINGVKIDDAEAKRNERLTVSLPLRELDDSVREAPKQVRRKKPTMGSRKAKLELTKLERRGVFRPCSHAGPCQDNPDCSCFREKVACEYFCGCDMACQRRFKGCNCAAGQNRVCYDDSRCECWNSSRECDPWLCKGCGVLEVLDQANKYNEEIRIGRCQNSRIQLGIPARTIKAPSEVQGYGLFAGADIDEGAFIGEYKGEIIGGPESDRRGALYHLLGAEYLFTLNADQQIDASNFGNKTRFMNNTNVDANRNVLGCTMLCSGVHRVMLYARRKIKAGEELLYNYGYPEEISRNFWERGEEPSNKKAVIDAPVAKMATSAKKEASWIRPRSVKGQFEKKSLPPQQEASEGEIAESSQPLLVRKTGKRKLTDIEVSESSYSESGGDDSDSEVDVVDSGSDSSDSSDNEPLRPRVNKWKNAGTTDRRFGGEAQRKAAKTRAKRLAEQMSSK